MSRCVLQEDDEHGFFPWEGELVGMLLSSKIEELSCLCLGVVPILTHWFRD